LTKLQILEYRPDLDVVSIRGNVETRIKRIERENLDGIILAAAGIKRLGLDLGNRVFYLDKEIMLPSPSQGILAIEIREDDKKMDDILTGISHEETEIQATVEREFLKGVGGSCKVPVGAHCKVLEDKVILEGLLGSENGDIVIRRSISENIDTYKEAGSKLAQIILGEMSKR